MTPLQQRFLDAIEKDIALDGSQYDDAIKAAAACEKIAEEFAAEFAEWISKNNWKSFKQNQWINAMNPKPYITSGELIQQFKEQSK